MTAPLTFNMRTLLAALGRYAPDEIPLEGVIEGDCLDVMRRLETAEFDACITDPPFGLAKKRGLAWDFSSHVTLEEEWDVFESADAYMDFTEEWLTEACRVVKPNGNVVVFGSYHSIYLVGAVLQARLNKRVINHIVWNKPNAQPNITARMLCEAAEHAIWFSNGAPTGARKATNWTFNYDEMKTENEGKQLRNVWNIPVTPAGEKRHGKHPTQKPRALIGRLVRALTEPGERILDPFGGSGTTLVEAQANGRGALLIEREREYVHLARARAHFEPQTRFDDLHGADADDDRTRAEIAEGVDAGVDEVLDPDRDTHRNLARKLWARGKAPAATGHPTVLAEYARLVELVGPPITYAPLALADAEVTMQNDPPPTAL